MSGGESLSGHVHSSLKGSADKASKAIDEFGAAVEGVLVKHGKNIVSK